MSELLEERIEELDKLINQAEFVHKHISKEVKTHLELLKVEKIHLQRKLSKIK